jgi:26S proteasome regulatory subunit N8
LVLLNCVDHYNRVAKNTSKRVVGVLLGRTNAGTVDITNSFAVPFEEDKKDPDVWYLDHNYLATMETMFRKVDAREYVVGFYSTGPKIRANDLQIEELMRKYVAQPIFVIIDVRQDHEGVPVKAYMAVETLQEDGKETKLAFSHLTAVIDATESEEVGVEHLLRDINDPTVSTLAGTIRHKMTALKGLKSSLEEMHSYLTRVLSGEMQPNNKIMYNIQSMFNLLPNLNVDALARAFVEKSNDMHLVIYISSIVRSVVALHDLVQNKIKLKGVEGFEAEKDKKEKKKDGADAGEESKDGKSANEGKKTDKP